MKELVLELFVNYLNVTRKIGLVTLNVLRSRQGGVTHLL